MAPFQLCLPQIGILKQRTVQISFGSCWDIVHKGLYRCSTRLARHQLKITLEFADIWLSKQVGQLSDDGRPYSNHPDAAAYKVFQALHSSHPYFDALNSTRNSLFQLQVQGMSVPGSWYALGPTPRAFTYPCPSCRACILPCRSKMLSGDNHLPFLNLLSLRPSGLRGLALEQRQRTDLLTLSVDHRSALRSAGHHARGET